ncbi:ankyrin repeat and KH domain-containing protein 1-like [Corticium candelabrum]|uniref:ankyrin repeat and KH domain-containing protein 1-like n=1 Tax=Corticium candelabrum TaxID=121492 RepID=UPI002E27516D|nr:ankyrin repeat and KH domain-containing protein 1-like [Corticium candelabrum]
MSSLSEMEKKLRVAVERGDIESVTRLLELDVDINSREEHGTTLLILACYLKNKEMVELLLTKSADVNVTCSNGYTALVLSALEGSQDIVDLLLNVKDINVMKKERLFGKTAIHCAAGNGHVTILERLLCCSVPVDINDKDGRTPLWWAACRGRVCCADVLLKHGASPQHESKSKGSPLEIAKKEVCSDVVEMMEEAIRLRSHPYVKGDVSIMRHQYEETIAELQSEVDKKEELRQSSLVHESEVRRLRTEIQEKEEEMRCLVSTLATVSRMASEKIAESHTTSDEFCLSQPPDDVMYAVSALACDQWSDVGLELGYTMPELNSLTSLITASHSKLHVILRTKAAAVGTSNVVGIILSACQRISIPICAAAIRDEVVKRQERLRAQNGGQ